MGVATAPNPLGSYSGKSGTFSGKFEHKIRANLKMKTFLFFRDQTNPYHTNPI